MDQQAQVAPNAGIATAGVANAATSVLEAPRLVDAQTIGVLTSLFKSCLYEYEYEVEDKWVEGTIPPDLKGTYFRNGPGLQMPNRHTFDGDGMILSFAFENGRAFFRNKFVRTKGFADEQAAGRPLYRNAFTRGSPDGSWFFNPFNFDMKNVANTGVLHWGNKLLALWEGGLPHELRPEDLGTVGLTNLDGQVSTKELGAHYRVVTQPDGTKRWVAFASSSRLGSGTVVTFYEFAEEGGRLLHKTELPLKDFQVTLIHDMVVTDNYYAVICGPIDLSMRKFLTEYLLSRCSIAECLAFNPAGQTKIFLVPRPGGSAAGIKTFTAPAFFSFHHANAYESPDGAQVIIDTAAWDEVSFNKSQHNVDVDHYRGGQRSRLTRVVLGLDNGSVDMYRLARRTFEFPSVNWAAHAKPHRYIYAVCDIVDDEVHWGPAQAVAKLAVAPTAGTKAPLLYARDVQLDTWTPGRHCIVNEPQFVLRPNAEAEDDGWLLVTVHDSTTNKGQLSILDARDVTAGPVCTLKLPHFLPAALHGSWTTHVFGRTSEAQPRWKEPNVVKQL